MTQHLNNSGTELEPYGGVPEGDVPTGSRPEPGPSAQRRAWTGKELDGEPVLLDPTRDSSREFGASRQLEGKRMVGLDVARGLALLGMVAVHTLPSWNQDTEESTLVWWLAAGNAAALFAVLAGVGLALISGGHAQVPGRRIPGQRGKLIVRAAMVFGIGLAVNQIIDPPVYNILPYYGLLFLMAVPFLGVRKRTLAMWAVGVTVLAPLVAYFVRGAELFSPLEVIQLSDLTAQPLAVVETLLFTGNYPTATWFVYVLVGLLVGRLALGRIAVQLNLLGYGILLALLGQGASYLSIWYLGGWERMLYSHVDVTMWDVLSAIYRGAEDSDLPTTSLAWLTVASPHTNTPFSLVHTMGLALAVLGATLLLCRVIRSVLTPLARLGSMTLTLYVGHLAFLSLGFFEGAAWLWFIVQLVAGTAFAYGWSLMNRQGPLELLVAKASDIPTRLIPQPAPGTVPRQARASRIGDPPSLAEGRHRRNDGSAAPGVPERRD
ncbi:heparan-alpha-glucosaminide N-acetyltransferase domain-containing protein [Corynebacterium halotolerans]|uniref:heparan-alpha-glucosaminide N-acetyltransferase domain-containing protein n=1 Tax=Corynebacterium halotolerans TaxID=225326 RepID=UPI003CE8EC45